MEGLVLGLDLCESYTQVSCLKDERTWTIPTVICREKEAENWYIGEDAYAHVLVGDGVIVDKLLKLNSRQGTATIGGVRYDATALLEQFLRKVLEIPQTEYGIAGIRQLVITLQQIDTGLMDILRDCTARLGLEDKQVRIIGHTESFVYYILSQKKEVWNNQVGLFDLSKDGLRYYELKVHRGLKRMTVVAEQEALEEGFNLDILKSASGVKLADKILCSCGERLMQKKLYSGVFLTGKGFETQEWATDFMQLICNKRRVYVEMDLFSKGAAYKAEDYIREKTAYPFTCICEGHLNTTVSMEVVRGGKDIPLTLASAGDNWFESSAAVEVIPDADKDITFTVTPLDVRKRKIIRIPLEGFPKRPPRTTRIRVEVSFLDERTMQVVLKDRGFGELFPATEYQVRQEVML